MSKEAFIEAHEAMVEEYLEAHPSADWNTAYDATADGAFDRMRDTMADRIDEARQQQKDR